MAALSQVLPAKIIRLTGSNFVPTGKVVINWGSTSVPQEYLGSCKRLLNPGGLVRTASNKKLFFEKTLENPAEAPRVPPFTTNKDVAAGWFNDSNTLTIFARTVLSGHSGEGIIKINNPEELAPLPSGTLLCRYIPKRREFRIHISKSGGVFVVQEKKAKSSLGGNVDFQIRNLANGFIFARNDLKDVPADVVDQAKRALAMTGLDFGAVDVIWNHRHEQAFVLEVNTAPGLEGSTLEDYATMFGVELGK